ncbi:MAG: dipeptide epimerase [Gammaproteobacteria bacterium]|nr:dipeptide epimerase [Gammaproteobacteria bacterium]MDH3435034.1 dipeptide epimerase [Gammaproteobacteria bacterium]
MLAQLESIADKLVAGANRHDLLDLLPPGGARNAADAALWDLEAQLSGKSAWEMAGVEPNPVETDLTIGLEAEPEDMARKAAAAPDYDLLKIKLDDDRPVERIAAIRKVRPDARLIVDVNGGWTFEQLQRFSPDLQRFGVELIEQPLPRGEDSELEGYLCPIPLCADESCLHLGELEQAANRYQFINIKLDKTGGLTHALQLAHAAKAKDLGIMVGSMCGSSLAMAPHHVVAQLAEYVDIDGPLLMKNDRIGGLVYDRGFVSLPETRFWG